MILFGEMREALLREAARRFGGHDGLFNTACFQSAFHDLFGFYPPTESIVAFLSSEPRLVRLSGGCHWMILPNGHIRFAEQGS